MKEGICMSEREQAIQILNEIPDYKIGYIVSYLQGYLHGMTDGEEMPNKETLEAFKEGDEMLANGTGKRYGSAADLFADMEN